jgi:thymidylate kinase
VVIFDRFPFKEFREMEVPMDGPRIFGNARLERYERSYYERIGAPDITILMQVDLEHSGQRKNEHGSAKMQNMIKDKISALSRLSESGKDDLVVIDTRKPHDEVLRQINNIVWDQM